MSFKKFTSTCFSLSLTLFIFPSFNAQADGPKEWLTNNNKTQVMVLATEHLSRYKERISAQDMEPLLDKLANFKPDVIGVEYLAPHRISSYIQRDVYKPTVDRFSPDILQLAKTARVALKQNASTALDNVLLSSSVDGSSDHKILTYLAGYDLYSAALHWSYLDDAQRNSAVLAKDIKDKLTKTLRAINENALIGIRLAKKTRRRTRFRHR